MKKIGMIGLALVLALGSLGVGFAHWSQTLYIDGVVKTGTFLTGFESCSTTDEGTTLDDTTGVAKHVGSTECTSSVKKGDHTYPDGTVVPMYEKISIVLDNVYPSYNSRVDFDIGNGGTIPAEVMWAKIVSTSHTTNLALPYTLTPSTSVIITIDGVTIKVGFHTSAGDTQIDPCQADNYYLEFHVEQEDANGDTTLQDTTVSFDIEIYTLQWNLK